MPSVRMVRLSPQQVSETHATKATRRIPPQAGKRVFPCTRGKYKEINVLVPKHLCVAQYDTHVNIPVKINGHGAKAMIDSGATGNFISWKYARWKRLPTQKKKDQYDLQMADGSTLSSRVDEETISLPLAIQRHHEELTFDVVGMATHDVILGMPWLKKHNPVIDWRRGVLTFKRTGDVTSI